MQQQFAVRIRYFLAVYSNDYVKYVECNGICMYNIS